MWLYCWIKKLLLFDKGFLITCGQLYVKQASATRSKYLTQLCYVHSHVMSRGPKRIPANVGGWVRQNTTVVASYFIELTMTTCFGRARPSSGHELIY